ncbi:hypothetical protein ACIQ1H_18755 [Lysinibacillus sp. NPDC097279]|uniref:hypothetical protein n=1 Tax=unclassified Lysinibacillus TaxID=2636778 RepID=UPI0019357524|nr:hypothetical protein JNUCC52_15690 [Lysinibacillus sp. JNUCC-52]
MIQQIVKWFLLTILIISSISFIIVLQSNYLAAELTARSIPIAIVVGFSSLAVAIMFRK